MENNEIIVLSFKGVRGKNQVLHAVHGYSDVAAIEGVHVAGSLLFNETFFCIQVPLQFPPLYTDEPHDGDGNDEA